jgi:hypothetical protein
MSRWMLMATTGTLRARKKWTSSSERWWFTVRLTQYTACHLADECAVEVRQRGSSYLQDAIIEQNVRGLIAAQMEHITIGEELRDWEGMASLGNHVERIWMADSSASGPPQ